MTPAVTVIVPGYDVAAYAVEALDSLRAQTRRDWTAVLVDDASTDDTGRLFAAAAAADERFRVVHHSSQRGLGAARNTALDLVRTPFLGFLDADDRLTPHALDRLLGTVSASGSDFAVGAYVRLRPDTAGGYEAGSVQPWVAAATAPARVGTTLDEHPDASGNIVAWSKVSRTDLWQRTGLRFPVGKAYEDQIVAQQMYTRARAFDVIPDVVVEWRERADGSSITQHKGELPVLRDYLEALAGGIEVLDAAGQVRAAASRVRLILAMDLPPLVELARDHPDEAYRRELGAFVRTLWSRVDGLPLPPPAATALAAARLW
ncbi:glycosyltransferase family 2 protein [Microbacterium sp. M3]|uniref:Glycosyltransferase family 2 protein n=1 Tax=Microbacterium arthrosphaerae TaxID=792652 RepID=A0ABU4GVT0_9MICO|nr:MULTISPECIES: glycosyltransferase family 2 protein [Microbacterium]MDW4571180.1 glycosyltransferase family 2 protein [Microbacterium arthrosphaerae]MDW7605035.1 glycosyltransferase family 2 protein [Microbacterium sp. M3]